MNGNRKPYVDDEGSTLTGFMLAVLVLALVAVGAFFYFGGRADVDVKKPDVTVTGNPNPPATP